MPTITPQEKLRVSIGQRARRLRQDRRWTQTQLAEALDLSQNRLSEIEHGKGSFTAEQLLTILKIFNVPLDYFAPPVVETVSKLQNALARLGAIHLAESREVLPTAALNDALNVVRETLVGAQSPRQLAAIAPVLVSHVENLNLARLRFELAEVGLGQRLGWVAENTLAAVRKELAGKLPTEWGRRYQRAELILNRFLSHYWPKPERKREECYIAKGPEGALVGGEDVLDPGIASGKTLEEVRKNSSKISRSWSIISRVRPEDFLEALRSARGSH